MIKWIKKTENIFTADDHTNKWEVVKSKRNETNKNISDPESVGVMNKFQHEYWT